MRQAYRNIQDVLNSPWAAVGNPNEKPVVTDRVLRSARLEDGIYSDLRDGDGTMDEVESAAGQKLHTFPALSRDIYQSFYSLMLRRNEESALSAPARQFNRRILDHVMESEEYPTIKNICEGREAPAYEAASEFIAKTAGELDALLSDFGGDTGALNTLEKLNDAERKAAAELSGLLERLRQSKERNETLEQAVINAANAAEGKRKQAKAVGEMIDRNVRQKKDGIAAILETAIKAASDKAEETALIISAWGDNPASMERNKVNAALLAHVRENPNLKAIARYLGRFREMFRRGKRNGYAYGRGEKYSLELGNDLSRVLTSELAMLASPLTAPLFLRKYQLKQMKQYRRREPIYKGMGDIICCLDESGSTQGDSAAWGKAVALTLLDIAEDGGRNFALVHFSGPGSAVVHEFRPGQYAAADKRTAAETFMDGGTDFETPMRKALSLIEEGGFEQADVVFITDGQCDLNEAYARELCEKQTALGFTVTGILLDANSPGMDFSLKTFCRNIYRTSELMGDEIVQELVNQRV